MIRVLRKAGALLVGLAVRQSAARTAVASFAAVICLGTFLLVLPISSKAGRWTSPSDALFTATSAVCVTGLIVKSTPDYWSLFGQLVILALIQAGGLGIMTLGAFMAILLQRRLSMRFESVMNNIVETSPAESVWTLVRFVCAFTLLAEGVGTVLLLFSWMDRFDNWWVCFYHSVFHAISAFCNAGFSLNNDSLAQFASSVSVNVVICALIVIGGIGFPVVRDLLGYGQWWVFERRGRRPRLATHSKLVLTMTAILLVAGFVWIFTIESSASLAGMSMKKKLLAAMFQSVTPRTAGFNTIPMGKGTIAPATIFLFMVLMYIGGSPGGTAGGIKTSTLGVMVASIVATLKGRAKAELFDHSVPEEAVHRVSSIILLSFGALIVGIFVLLITEAATFQAIAFDAISAFGTVGLTIGLTGPDCTLSMPGRVVLTALMFVGRLGPITLVLSMAQTRERASYKLPEEQILVG